MTGEAWSDRSKIGEPDPETPSPRAVPETPVMRPMASPSARLMYRSMKSRLLSKRRRDPTYDVQSEKRDHDLAKNCQSRLPHLAYFDQFVLQAVALRHIDLRAIA